MKRSEINTAINEGLKTLKKISFMLPDFSGWSVEHWKKMRPQALEIIKTGMGWDVTDFGSNDFANVGATIFTIRNGYVYDENIGVPYAEKIIIMTEGQIIPLHFHFKKTEDIINRGNGVLCVKLYNSNPDESLDETSKPKIKCEKSCCVKIGNAKTGHGIHTKTVCYLVSTVKKNTFERHAVVSLRTLLVCRRGTRVVFRETTAVFR